MTENTPKTHREYAIELFNKTWELLDKEERTAEDTDHMIHAAHASRYHWGVVGEPIHWQRGEWQVSRVYAVARHPHACLYHAQRCMMITETYEIEGFDRAFAHEALARAYSLMREEALMEMHLALGKQAAEKVEEKEDREYTLGELNNIHIE
ncbi:MAG: hypothetical protein V2J07_04065 [Anaerolineae bacterium]|nr:hypothetical protein [Anaerolineae bacterium]